MTGESSSLPSRRKSAPNGREPARRATPGRPFHAGDRFIKPLDTRKGRTSARLTKDGMTKDGMIEDGMIENGRRAVLSVDMLALLVASLAVIAALTGALHDIRW